MGHPADYFNVRTGEECRITVGESRKPNVIPVLCYQQILSQYLNNPESKFLGPDGTPCNLFTRGVLQRMHVIAGQHIYCGKEMKRKLEQGPIIDGETLNSESDEVRVYSNGRVAAGAEMLHNLSKFSEREIRKGTGVRRDTIRSFRHGGIVTRKMYQRFSQFLTEQTEAR